MLNRQSRFIAETKDGLRLTLLCGLGGFGIADEYRFPLYAIEEKVIVKSQYPNDNPQGIQLGSSAEIVLNINAFDGEDEDLWEWIYNNNGKIVPNAPLIWEPDKVIPDSWTALDTKANSYVTNRLQEVPNVWILSENKSFEEEPKIYYIGVQTAVVEDEFEVSKSEATYKISTIDLFKYAMDYADICAAPPDELTIKMDRHFTENSKVRSGESPKIRQNSYKLVEWQYTFTGQSFLLLKNTVLTAQTIMKVLLRNPNEGSVWFKVHDLFKNFRFFKQNFDSSIDKNWGSEIDHSELNPEADELYFAYLVYKSVTIGLGQTDSGIKPHGLYSKIKNKYKNMWNFLSKFYDNYGLIATYEIKISTEDSTQQIPFRFLLDIDNRSIAVNTASPYSQIGEANLPPNKFKIKVFNKKYNEIIMRLNTSHNEDIAAIRKDIGSNLSKEKLNFSIDIDTAPTKSKEYSKRGMDDNSMGIAETSFKSTDTPNISKFYYFDEGSVCKVAETVSVKVGTGEYFYTESTKSIFDSNDLASMNETLDELQRYSLSNTLAELMKKFYLDNPYFKVEIDDLDIDIANTSDLGKEYQLDLNFLTTSVLRLKTSRFKTRAVLVNCETDYYTQKSKCIFFIRGDEWA